MANKTVPPTLSPLVAEGLTLIAEAEAIAKERDAIAVRLKAKDAELQAVNEKLIALGAGRYCDTENHVATVVGAVPATMGADDFRLPKDGEALARELAGDNFLKLFQRKVSFSPRDDFRGLVLGRLTPKKAEELIALCIIPGQMQGGRRAYVRWR